MDQIPCSECNRLWKQYEGAVFVHVRVRSQFELARLSYDRLGLERLSAELESAEGKRATLQTLIANHNREVHSMDASSRFRPSSIVQPVASTHAA